MAHKIRYLQEYKEDREQMRIEFVKSRHVNDRLKKETKELREENRVLNRKIQEMKDVMIAYDRELIEDENEDE
jgi:CHASE3 domain sensor protein